MSRSDDVDHGRVRCSVTWSGPPAAARAGSDPDREDPR